MATLRRSSLLFLLTLIALPSSSPAAAAEPPVVHAVLFWDATCPNCERVLDEVLPPLEERYGPRLHIVRPEVSTVTGFDLFLAAGQIFEIPPERQGVPLLVIGDTVLSGADEIAEQLETEIERGLAAGGTDLPPALGLTPEAVAALEAEMPALAHVQGQVDPIANAAALVVLAAMVLGLLYVGMLPWRTPLPDVRALTEAAPHRLSWWIPVLSLVGLAASGYMARVKLLNTTAICPVGNCSAVQHSKYAELFGVPVAVFGFLTYVGLLALWLWAAYGRGRTAEAAPMGLFGLSLFGTAFSTYLTFLEPFVIKAVCFWCLTSAVTITLIMLLSARQVLPRAAPGPPEQGARSP